MDKMFIIREDFRMTLMYNDNIIDQKNCLFAGDLAKIDEITYPLKVIDCYIDLYGDDFENWSIHKIADYIKENRELPINGISDSSYVDKEEYTANDIYDVLVNSFSSARTISMY